MMRKLDAMYLYGKTWAEVKIRDFLQKEDGDVNIVSIVVIIGIVIILATLFKGRILALLNTLFDKINTGATDAITG